MDKGSKTDPFLILYQLVNGAKKRIGVTEVIIDSLNPEFVTEIDVDYYFEE